MKAISALWPAVRRRVDVPENGAAIGYDRGLRVILWAMVVTSPLELVVVHHLLPWAWVRWAHLVLAVAAVLWSLGFIASLWVYPHAVDDERLRIRFGGLLDVVIPVRLIESVRAERVSKGQSKLAEMVGETLSVEVGGMTNLVVRLREPYEVNGFGRVRAVRFTADDPREAVRQVTRYISHSETLGQDGGKAR
ncbi:hypothetical protein AB0J63_28225 [Streptosporangium canum]|uniref:hypothetical protein n=1 Tax=Streptosporangium canum TaxID=324952 RepID=UPI00341F6D4F